MSRVTVTVGFLVVSALVIWAGFTMVPEGSTTESLLINLGTEIMGIVIILAVVEWFFERRRAVERGRQVAWSALHAVEHVVWVWQGGPREVDTDQLLGMLRATREDAPLPDFTQNLLLSLGTRAKQALHNDKVALEALPGLMTAFEELARLNAIREGGRLFAARKVGDILELGTLNLARALGQSTEPMPARLIRYVDASEDAQELRYFGGSGGNGGDGGSGGAGGIGGTGGSGRDVGARRLERPGGEAF
jgi:uncharacterized membrane protein YgcG